MSKELPAIAGPTDTVIFSNITVVRNTEGELTVWCGDEKIIGTTNVQIANGALVLAVPLTRVRLAENVPATPVIETKDNVIQFTNFRKYHKSEIVEPTEGESA